MIKKILLAIAILLPFTCAAQAKFGVVNTQEIIQALPETAAAQSTLEQASKKYEEELKKLQDEMQKAYTEYQNLPADTPESIKERRIQSIQELDQRAQQFRTTASEDLQKQQQQLLAPIQERIQKAIQQVGDAGAYTMIFETIVPVYVGTGAEDVTAKVKTNLGIK